MDDRFTDYISGTHVSKDMASWAGKVMKEEEDHPNSQPQKRISAAEKIWAQWKKQGERE